MAGHPAMVYRLLPSLSSDADSTYSGNSSTSSEGNATSGSTGHTSATSTCTGSRHSGGGAGGARSHPSGGHSGCTSPGRQPSTSGLSRLRLQSGIRESDLREEPGGEQELPPGTSTPPRPPLLPPPDGSAKPSSSTLLKRKRPPRLDIPAASSFSGPSAPGSGGASCGGAHVVDLNEEALNDIAVEGAYYALYSKRGHREILEDTYQAVPDVGGDHAEAAFGVYDGHGGRRAADFAAEHLVCNILDAMAGMEDGAGESAAVEAAFRAGYLETDRAFLEQRVESGASCVTGVVRGGALYVANAGDCRAVMSRRGVAEALTSDHRASRDDERDRIESLGGQVDMHMGTWRVQGVLAVSRGLGDLHLKEYISAEPETSRVALTSDCEFLVLASDGLWDVVANQEVVDTARPLMGLDRPSFSDIPPLAEMEDVQGEVDSINTPRPSRRGKGAADAAASHGTSSVLHATSQLFTPRGRRNQPVIFSKDPHSKLESPGTPPPPQMCGAADRSAQTSAYKGGDAVAMSEDEGDGMLALDICDEEDEEGLLDIAVNGQVRGKVEDVLAVESPLPATGPLAACRRLVEVAIDRGSHDDVSVMVVWLPHFQQGERSESGPAGPPTAAATKSAAASPSGGQGVLAAGDGFDALLPAWSALTKGVVPEHALPIDVAASFPSPFLGLGSHPQRAAGKVGMHRRSASGGSGHGPVQCAVLEGGTPQPLLLRQESTSSLRQASLGPPPPVPQPPPAPSGDLHQRSSPLDGARWRRPPLRRASSLPEGITNKASCDMSSGIGRRQEAFSVSSSFPDGGHEGGAADSLFWSKLGTGPRGHIEEVAAPFPCKRRVSGSWNEPDDRASL